MSPLIGVLLAAACGLAAIEVLAPRRPFGWSSHLGLPSFRQSGPVEEGRDIVGSLRSAGLNSTLLAPGTWLVRSMSWVEQGARVPPNLAWGVGILRMNGSSWLLEVRCSVGPPLFLAGMLLGLLAPWPTGPLGVFLWVLAWVLLAALFFKVQIADARRVFEPFQKITTRTTME